MNGILKSHLFHVPVSDFLHVPVSTTNGMRDPAMDVTEKLSLQLRAS